MVIEAMALSASVADTLALAGTPDSATSVAGHVATGDAGPEVEKVWPALTAPKLLVVVTVHTKSPYVDPVPVSASEEPTGSVPAWATPMSVEISPFGRAADRREHALVAEELLDRTARIDERQPVGRPVLETRDRDGGRSVTASLVGDHATEGGRAVRRAAVAVVQDERPAGEVGAGWRGDLHGFARVGAVVVVVQLVDEHRARRIGDCRRARRRHRRQPSRSSPRTQRTRSPSGVCSSCPAPKECRWWRQPTRMGRGCHRVPVNAR